VPPAVRRARGRGGDRIITQTREPHMQRFHIALAVRDLDESIRDYSERLDQPPTAVVPGIYAMWRTAQLNFSINQSPERAGQLRHLGFEDDSATGFSSSRDVNGIEWELFSGQGQDERIVSTYGRALRA
jgi:catechol 2,3-dioxygenase-like lactoylglutathione lyase family enzyme